MFQPIHRYGVLLVHRPGNSSMQFLHSSNQSGTQVWDEQLWPIGPDIKTEAQWLSELYAGVLTFMERRA